MIKLENVVLASPEQMEFIIEGMRNPMNSWEKSDSYPGYDCSACGHIERDGICSKGDSEREHCYEYYGFELGNNDHSLMQRLSNAGAEHRKYMRMMPVYVRITAPLYWWKEFDTYKVGTVANSCSTMHKIAEKEFTLDDFSCEHLGVFIPAEKNDGIENYQNLWIATLEEIIDSLNVARTLYNRETDPKLKKNYWWQMIQLLPSSYNQTRNVMLNYEVLANIYRQRKNHKLDEWREFCKWIESLPYSELITGEGCTYTLNDCVRCVEYKRKPYNAEPPICHLCTVYDKQHGIECQFDEDKSLTDEMIQERIKNRNGSPVYNETELYWKKKPFSALSPMLESGYAYAQNECINPDVGQISKISKDALVEMTEMSDDTDRDTLPKKVIFGDPM